MDSFQLLRRRTTELFHSLEQTLPSSKGHGPQVPTMKATWEKLQLPPLPRSSHTADVVAGTLYIFGGEVEPRRPVDNDMHAITLPASGAPADYYAIKAKPARPQPAEPVESRPANAAEAAPAKTLVSAKPAAPAKPKASAEDTGSSADSSSSDSSSSDEDSDDDDDSNNEATSSEDGSSEEESSSEEEDDDDSKKAPSSAAKGKAPATAADTPLPDVPPPRVGHASAVIGHRIFIFGGRGGPDMAPLDERGRVWVFDTRTHLCYHAAVATPKPDAPQTVPLASGAAAAAPGHKPSASESSVEAWRDWALGTDPEKAATFGTPQNPVVGVLAERAVDAESDGYGTFLVHGGCLGDGSRAADVWAFDVRSRVWQRLPDAPGPARGGAALALSHRAGGGRLYRFGGFDGNAPQGGRLDVLPLGLDVFDDQVARGEAVLVARPSGAAAAGAWQTVLFGQEDVGYREPDPVAARRWPATASRSPAAAASRPWRSSPRAAAASQRAACPRAAVIAGGQGGRGGLGRGGRRRSRSSSKADGAEAAWCRVETRPHDDEDDASADGPGPRGWVASSPLRELEENAIVVFGGLDEQNRRLGDAWILRLE
ncbi:hypothetical protein VTJ83DRAFT_7342 [Remersonia thermophila]|uniref:Uncharacterized protein n=1 Tax=Remersonia thermophila TaxID=72144 RepID=A0ABR4D382_9PEZI